MSCQTYTGYTAITGVIQTSPDNFVVDRVNRHVFAWGNTATGGNFITCYHETTLTAAATIIGPDTAVGGRVACDSAGYAYDALNAGFQVKQVVKRDPLTLAVLATSPVTSAANTSTWDLRAGYGSVALATQRSWYLYDSNLNALNATGDGAEGNPPKTSVALDAAGNAWFLIAGNGGTDPVLQKMPTTGLGVTNYTLPEVTYGQPNYLAYDAATATFLIGNGTTGQLFFWSVAATGLVATLAGCCALDAGGAFRSGIDAQTGRFFYPRSNVTISKVDLDNRIVECTIDLSALATAWAAGSIEGGSLGRDAGAYWVDFTNNGTLFKFTGAGLPSTAGTSSVSLGSLDLITAASLAGSSAEDNTMCLPNSLELNTRFGLNLALTMELAASVDIRTVR